MTFIRRTLIVLNNHRCHHMQNLSQDDHTFKCKTKTMYHFTVYQITLYTSNIYNYICQLSSIRFKKTKNYKTTSRIESICDLRLGKDSWYNIKGMTFERKKIDKSIKLNKNSSSHKKKKDKLQNEKIFVNCISGNIQNILKQLSMLNVRKISNSIFQSAQKFELTLTTY